MPLETIAEANKYSTTTLLAGVVEEIIAVSPVFQIIPVMEILGNSLTYNRESSLPSAEFKDPGEVWTEGGPVLTAVTATLKILGTDVDVDNFLKLTRSNQQDLEAEYLSMSVKGVGRTAQSEMIYGDVDDINAKGWDGFHEILGVVTGGQDVLAGSTTTGGPGTFSDLDEMIDKVKPSCDALMMSRRTLRQMRKLARSQGWFLALSDKGSINAPLLEYGGVPILINDFQLDTEDVVDGGFGGKTGDDTSSIFGMHLGADGLHMIEAGPGIQIEDIGILESKDATRRRIKWYTALILKSTKALARLSGVDTQDWTN